MVTLEVLHLICICVLSGLLFHSAAGALLSKTLHALLLLPVSQIQPLLFLLLGVLGPMDRLNRVLPAAALPDLELPDTASGVASNAMHVHNKQSQNAIGWSLYHKEAHFCLPCAKNLSNVPLGNTNIQKLCPLQASSGQRVILFLLACKLYGFTG